MAGACSYTRRCGRCDRCDRCVVYTDPYRPNPNPILNTNPNPTYF